MKKRMLAVVCSLLIVSFCITAIGECLRDDVNVKIRSAISLSGSSVSVNISGITPPGYTLSISAVIQENDGSSWYNATSQTTGNESVRLSCTGASGYSYRGYYTYILRDSSGSAVASGSGYTTTKQIP